MLQMEQSQSGIAEGLKWCWGAGVGVPSTSVYRDWGNVVMHML